MVHTHEIARVFDRLAEEQDVSGAVLVAQDGEVVFEKAYGFASWQLQVANGLDTKFHIASVTKMFIAMAVLILYEQGRLELQERPAVYLPELAGLNKEITIHHLLSHTSGLQEVYDVPHLRFEMSKLRHEKGDLLSYLVKLPQLFRAGEGWSYSSTGYILMGYVMERVTGLSFAELMRQYVLGPLKMTNTGLDNPRKINVGRAYGHTFWRGEMVNAANDRLSMFEDAPGELYSTVRDMKKWCDAMFDCPLVSQQTRDLMWKPYGEVSPTLRYGYGWFLGSHFRMHGGGTPGFVSRVRQYPEQRVSVVMLLNSDHVNVEEIVKEVEEVMVGGTGR